MQRWQAAVGGVMAALALALAGGLAWGQATAPATRAATTPASTQRSAGRWEALPESVYSVFIGPDQRRWHVTLPQGLGKAPDLAAIKTQVAAQWKQPTPLLQNCWPMLFEKSGALWLVTADRQTLLRYDGTEWLTRTAQGARDRGKFIGVCPGYGRSTNYTSNLEVGNLRLFIETEGISVFDGAEWTYQKLMEDPGWYFIQRMVLLPEQDAQGVAVVQTLTKSLWRYRQGKWTRVALPDWCKKEEFANAALAPDGSLWLGTAAGIQVLPLDGRKVVATQPTFLPGLTESLPELKLNGLDVNQYWARPCQDEAGNVYVGVSGLPPEVSKTQRGTFVLTKDGATKFYPGSALGYGLYGFNQTPLICGDGRTFWCNSTLQGGDRRMCRVDLTDASTLVHRPVSETLQFVQSEAADGTAYLSVNDPLEPYRDQTAAILPSVMAYHATATDDRPVVRVATHVVADDSTAVASDGAVWAWLPLKGLCRFDGRDWKPVAGLGAAGPAWTRGRLFPGKGGAMLAWSLDRTSERFALWQGGKWIEGTDLPTLVLEHRQAFTAAFGAAQDPGLWLANQQRLFIMVAGPEGGFSIATDKQGRMWLAIDRTLRVLDDGAEWTKAPWPSPMDPPPRQAGMAATKFELPNGPSLVVPIGAGEAMYVVDHRGESLSPGKAYVAKVAAGKVEWMPAPAPTDGLVRDTDGALWVAYRRTPEGRLPSTGADETMLDRVDAGGSTAQHVVPAPPVLLDRAGILWLAGRGQQGMRSGEFVLWKSGQVVGHARVPGVWNPGSLVSDQAGSVWVWTNVGLQHLVAEDPARPAEYKLKSTSLVAGPDGDPLSYHALHCAACDQGLLIKSYFTAENRMTNYQVLLLPTTGK